MTQRSIEHRTKVPEIRKGDTVVVLAGKDAGKRGTVERIIRLDPSPTPLRSGYRRTSAKGGVSVVVEGLNIARKHTKPRQRNTGSSIGGGVPSIDPGGVLDRAMPVPISRVMVVCGHCDRPTRVGHRVLDNGTRVRVCRHCGEPLEVKA
ncbi:MAG: 50S ribosomal protein L24 [Chloroflexi bacterium RBG_16_72_14]|nr:MAG: 50S ribosomal protein L24 [Chloroflexi bacterium RBG_16_72_14]